MKTVFKMVVATLWLVALSAYPAVAGEKMHSLCQYHYPTDYLYEWNCVQLTPYDTPSKVFGRYWKDGLRFNRIDRRHFLAGMWIKVPRHLKQIKNFNPMPPTYPEAETEPQFILVDQNEMFLGAYEYGNLVFSAPVAVGIEGYRLRNGEYRIDAADARHESSLYLMEGTDRPYPMHYGLRFYIDKRLDGWSTYWLHGRDVPGYPASHGCIGLYDEEMQNEYYNEPEHPILMDAKRLYEWVIGQGNDTGTFHRIDVGPRVVIMGDPPVPTDDGTPTIKVIPATAGHGAGP
jgi:hypothetical protein